MTAPVSKVFIAFQANEEARPIVDAILRDNPHAEAVYSPGLVKIDAPRTLVVNRRTIEDETGQDFDLQQLQVNLITLSGNVEETDDSLTLTWHS